MRIRMRNEKIEKQVQYILMYIYMQKISVIIQKKNLLENIMVEEKGSI